ncbi:MAG: tetratricopeptide repeat protein, partial [Oscillospiraceae bacterium]
MKQKTRIIIYIAIAVTVLALGILAVLSASKGAAESVDKHIDLGNKYLLELSYDKAVIEFNKAIEIEPKNADAYIGLAEAYIGLGDEDKAREVFELGYERTGDERIKEMLDELLGVTEEESTVT